MFNRLRNAIRAVIDHELGVVGDELKGAEDRLIKLAAEVEGLRLRYNAMQARVGMRMARAPADPSATPKDATARLLRALEEDGAKPVERDRSSQWPEQDDPSFRPPH